MNIMDAIKTEAADTNLVRTENGALGFAQCRSAIVDFFYKISTMRNEKEGKKQSAFLSALAEDRDLAMRMLFFARDVRQGLGERRLFRDIFGILKDEDVVALLRLIPEYGRWDDLIDLLTVDGYKEQTYHEVLAVILHQLNADIESMKNGGSVSLLAKWLPSIRKVNKDKVKLAKYIAKDFGLSEKEYRKTLSSLRKYLKVVEKQMSAGQWAEIDFNAVPSKAAKTYRNAFKKHDEARYTKYLEGLKTGETKVNAGAMYPYEIVAAYRRDRFGIGDTDDLLEAQWKALPLPKGLLENAIVVRDGSGSMTTEVSSKATALDVATSLAVLMSEHLKGPFKDRFITFSSSPKFVDLGGCTDLRQKLVKAFQEAECSNTDIERTMELVLNAAVRYGLKQEEIPAVVIVSDMEFDEARAGYYWHRSEDEESQKTLFDTIRRQWKDKGYDLPKMVFWNTCSRTGAVPMQENKNGLILVSGFSQNIMDMLSGDGNMLDIIRKKLNTPRYDAVSKALELAKLG